MNRLVNISLVSITAIAFSACASFSANLSSVKGIDVEKVCSVQNNGIENVIQTAEKYNEIAKRNELEFRRLGVNNSDLIISVKEAIKTGANEVNPKDFKSKASKTKLPVEFAAHRACKFAISALTQANEAKTTWRLAVPGDGYEY